MSSGDDSQTHVETAGEPAPGNGDRGSAFGLRAAVLAGLIAATAAGGAVAGIIDDPVRMVTDAHSTCCPPHLK